MSPKNTVFISYSHRDESWKDRLVRQLRVLQRQGLLDVWDDRRIGGGEDWRAEIDAAMARARVAVLLVSADFLSSDFILDEEVPRLLQRRKSEGVRVIPVIVRPCDWLAVGWLAEIQTRPRDGRPLSAGNEHQVDSELATLAAEIRELLDSSAPVSGADSSGAAEEPAPSPADLELRHWPPPPYPPEPYPLLLPYSHPDLLGGRDRELAELRRQLAKPIPILGLYAPSGAGKSSLLNAGLVPALRAEGAPVALDRHPHEPGLAERLIGHLLVAPGNGRPRVGGDPGVFVACLKEVREQAETPALLVLDQFEDVLRDDAARAEVGVLLASTVKEQLAGEPPLCRWLLAHRRDAHGDLKDWLDDVLAEARRAGQEVGGLPFNLSHGDRFHPWRLPLLGAPPPGDDRIDEPLRAFRAAIEAPLGVVEDDGTPRYPQKFAGDGAARLARAFAEARLEQREAPLAPELQVVLAHLERGAERKSDGTVEIALEETEGRIGDALDAHLRSVLKGAFPAGSEAAARRGRTRALLALRELASAQGRTDEGIPASRLAAAIGEDGPKILSRLAAPDARLIVARDDADDPEGKSYLLSHDRLAEAVVRAVEEEGTKLDVDRELLRLRKLVALNAELYREGETRQATDLDRKQYGRVGDNAEALLWDDERKGWWRACRRRRRDRRRRLLAWSAAVSAILAFVGFQLWLWVQATNRNEDLLTKVSTGHGAMSLAAVNQLVADGVAPERIAERLRERERKALLAVFEAGPEEIGEAEWGSARLDAVSVVLPSLNEGNPDDLELVGALAWVLDDTAARYPALAVGSSQLRAEVLKSLMPRQIPPRGDPNWVDVPGGTFIMGSPEGVGYDNEYPAHEVTVSPFRMLVHEVTVEEYRRLVPDHPGEPNQPVVNVTWYEAYVYAAWLGGRLPTEAEWEYAARANCEFDYCDREGEAADVDDVAWYGDPSGGLHEPCGKEPNPFGLCDMHGNAWEWVADWYGPYSEEAVTDPWGPPRGGVRVFRGGSFGFTAVRARSACRGRWLPGVEIWYQGFRVVLPRP